MKYFVSLVLAASITMSTSANATVIRAGNIITDDTTNYMEDAITGRLYTRLHATVGRTYEQLTTVDILSGGVWEGWSIGTSEVSDDLINALLGFTSPCTGAVQNGSTCGKMTDEITRVLGGDIGRDEYWVYKSTYDTPLFDEYDLGAVFLLPTEIYDYDDNTNIKNMNYFSSLIDGSGYYYMLYKNAVVKEPSSLAILAISYIWFAARRFKK